MSRYVRVELAVDVAAADQLRSALARLGLDATAAEIPGGLMLTGSGASPTCSFRSAAATASRPANAESEVVFAILRSAAAALRA